MNSALDVAGWLLAIAAGYIAAGLVREWMATHERTDARLWFWLCLLVGINAPTVRGGLGTIVVVTVLWSAYVFASRAPGVRAWCRATWDEVAP